MVTKYVQELVEVETIEPGSQRRLNTLFKLLEEKQGVLKALDKEIVTTYPTDDIEQEVEEAEEVYEKIVESLATIECVKLELTVQVGEIGASNGEHSLSREQSITRDNLTVRTNTIKTGAPAVSRSGSYEDLEATARSDETVYTIKSKLPKITLPRFSGEITKFRAFWDSLESAVDKNPSLYAVDKFNYLNALLEGSAA